MFSFFKTRSGNAKVAARAASRVQPSPVSTARAEAMAGEGRLDSLTSLATINGITVVQYGARVAVVGALLMSVLEHLPTAMRANIAESFRERIEDLLSLGDDNGMSEQFQSALLTEVNRYLNALR
jgi:hypothetical protein